MTRLASCLTVLFLVVACSDEPAAPDELDVSTDAWDAVDVPDDAAAPGPSIHETCGDPVCSTWRYKGYPACPARVEPGMRCPERLRGQACDPGNDCNTLYTCSYRDPAEGPCPISLKAAKRDIAYLDADQRAALARELLDVRLATYRYKVDGEQAAQHLGFLIDDVAPSPAVLADGRRVDLYGYTSMAVATIQQQERELEALRAQVGALEARLARLESSR